MLAIDAFGNDYTCIHICMLNGMVDRCLQLPQPARYRQETKLLCPTAPVK